MYKAAAGLVANRRYTNIATFSGGLPAWKKAGLPLDTSRKLPAVDIPMIDTRQFRQSIGEACIVDIRIPRMYKLGYFTKYLGSEMQSADNAYFKKYFHKIPLAHFSGKYKHIPMDRPVVVIDHNGKRAGLAARFLRNQGYPEVSVLKGGLMAFDKK